MHNMQEANFSTYIRDITAITGWTHAELAARLGVHTVTVSGWLHGRSLPRRFILHDLAFLHTCFFFPAKLSSDETAHLLAIPCTADTILANTNRHREFLIAATYHSLALDLHPLTINQVRGLVTSDHPCRTLPLSEQILIKNHAATLDYLLHTLSHQGASFHITPELIRELHLRLFSSLTFEAGVYRQAASRLPGLGHFTTHLPALAREFTATTKDPFQTITATHAAFCQLLPFATGTHLTARLLLIAACLYHELVPPIITTTNKNLYRTALTTYAQTQDLAFLRDIITGGSIFTRTLLFPENS